MIELIQSKEQLRAILKGLADEIKEERREGHNPETCQNCIMMGKVKGAFEDQIVIAATHYMMKMLSNPFSELCKAILEQLCVGIRLGMTLAENNKLEEIYKIEK